MYDDKPGTKTCRVCKVVKDVSEFSPHKGSKDGFAYRCKPCQADAKRKRRLEQPDLVRATSNSYYHRNKEAVADKNLQRAYGITRAQRDAMEAAQGGLCAACGSPPQGKRHVAKLFVDHCHATGKVRGLLCHSCNVALGLLQDDPVRIRALLTFAERR